MKLTRFLLAIKQLNMALVLLTILVLALLLWLGIWQSDRADEKQQRLTRIASLTQQASLSLMAVQALAGQGEDINDLPVKFIGNVIEDKVFLLDNQFDNNRLGYRVLQLMQVEQQWLLVNLGWVAGSVDRQQLPPLVNLAGQQQIIGNIRLVDVGIQLQPQQFEHVSWPLRIQQIELDKLATLLKLPLLPFVVYLDKNATIGYKKNWQPVVMPPEKHQGYAFQWFSLALAWLVLMLSAWYKKFKSLPECR